MSEDEILKIISVANMIASDCVDDAHALDRTPFTPAGMGPVFGHMLAQIKALALMIASLAQAVDEPRRDGEARDAGDREFDEMEQFG